tara:strand:+ start:5281 stop:5565 length:285 start_codon:yes stop_codon:yes gene_type:complete
MEIILSNVPFVVGSKKTVIWRDISSNIIGWDVVFNYITRISGVPRKYLSIVDYRGKRKYGREKDLGNIDLNRYRFINSKGGYENSALLTINLQP